MLESLFLLLPISILFVLLIGVALWWAVFSGQFEDLDAAGKSILLDDDSTPEAESKQHALSMQKHDNDAQKSKKN